MHPVIDTRMTYVTCVLHYITGYLLALQILLLSRFTN